MTGSGRRFVLVLAGTAFVEWLGASAILPLLPAYLRHHGSSPGVVGLVMSSYFVAGLVLQYPLGHLGDRIGQRPILVGGLLSYALGSLGFLLDPGAGGYVALRAAQGAGAGAVQVASFALDARSCRRCLPAGATYESDRLTRRSPEWLRVGF